MSFQEYFTQVVKKHYRDRSYNAVFAEKVMQQFVEDTGYFCPLSTAIDYYIRKFKLIVLTNKNNEPLKVFSYEEIINSPDGISEENCTECESLSSQEEQDPC